MARRRYSMFWVSVRSLADHQLEEFKEFSELIEGSMKQRLDDLISRYRADMEEADPDHQENLAEYYAEDGQKLEKSFPQCFRQSLFLTIYSFLEQQLAFLCKHYERLHTDRVLLEDLSHRGIVQYSVYLSKVVGVPFPESSPSWQRILKYNKLRNQLVHVGPKVGRGDQAKKLRNTISQLPGVAVSPQGEIVLDESSCDELIKCVEEFVAALFKVLPQE